MKLPLAALAILLFGALPARGDDFTVGYNQGWIDGKFGTSVGSGFDEADWKRIFKLVHEGGGAVCRVWLFEGSPMDGVLWDKADPHVPVGVDPAFLQHVERLSELAKEQGIRIYWTGHDGNAGNVSGNVDTERLYNVLNDKYGFGAAFQAKVLGPVLDAIVKNKESVYAFDAINEIEGALSHGFFERKWEGARAFMGASTAFVHSHSPGIKVSSSAGWGSAASDLLAGRFDGLGLDFLDVHFYSNKDHVASGSELVAHARGQGVPILIGELGQDEKDVDPELQAKVVRGVLADAKRLGFSGALVWRLEDKQPADKRFSFYDGDVPRPAVSEIKKYAKPAPALRSIGLVGRLGRR